MLAAVRIAEQASGHMCGKFTQAMGWSDAVEFATLQQTMHDGPIETVTPMRLTTVVALDQNGRRRAVRMRWGLMPPGAREAGVKPHIHARAETIDTKPTFREAFAKRRGLVMVTSFNEGREITPTKTEQYVVTSDDGILIAIAVIWEPWQDQNGARLLTYAMVTVPAAPPVSTITDRMPALIEPKDWPVWLGETDATLGEVKALLQPSSRRLYMRAAKPPPSLAQPDLF